MATNGPHLADQTNAEDRRSGRDDTSSSATLTAVQRRWSDPLLPICSPRPRLASCPNRAVGFVLKGPHKPFAAPRVKDV